MMGMMVKALGTGFSVQEVPITFVDRLNGESKRDGTEIVHFVKSVSSLWLKV